MREDMFKIIVERPRWGSRHATKSKLRLDKCPGRSHVTGKRLASEIGYTKHLSENLAPLRRFLHKQVGRRQDDVFSEICKCLDAGSTVKMHVREHLDDFILRKVRRKADGYLWAVHKWGREQKVTDMWVELYVDPDSGLICRTRDLCAKNKVPFARDIWKRRNASMRDATAYIRKISVLSRHVKLGGIWYFIEFSQIPVCEYGREMPDNMLYPEILSGTWRDHHRWRIVLKIQLCRKKLKALGLQNTPNVTEAPYG